MSGTIYKYKSLSRENFCEHEDILKNQKMFFCLGHLLNDPFEGHVNKGYNFFSNLFKNNGVCSFSQVHDNLLMWAHYAKSHYGLCYEFDKYEMVTSIKKELDILKDPYFYSGNVNYCDELPSVFSKSLEELSARDFIFNKSNDWSYEKEYRIVVSNGNRKVPFSIESLKGVYIGASIPLWHPCLKYLWDSLIQLSDNVQIHCLGFGQSHYGVQVKETLAPSCIQERLDKENKRIREFGNEF